MIVLPKDAYKRDLLHWVYSISVDDCDSIEYELLKKVCTCYLHNGEHPFQIAKIQISQVEKLLIEERDYIHADDIEIRARFMDVALRCGLYRKDRLSLKRECSTLYLRLAELQHDCFAFVRSVLVRDVPVLWDELYVSSLLEILGNEDINPLWIVEIADRLKVNIGTDSCVISDLIAIYEQRCQKDKQQDYQWQLNYIDLLLVFGKITKQESHLRKALVHEADGDNTIRNKEPNTLYPNLHQTFQDAFNEIDLVKKNYPEDWQRIHAKLVDERKNFVEMLSFAGVHTKYEVSVEFQKQTRDDLLPQMNFDNPMDVLLLLMNAPFFPAYDAIMKELRNKWSQESPIIAMCFNMAKVNSEGNTVGVSKDDAGFNVQSHQFMRLHTLFYLWTIVEHFHSLRLCLDEEKAYGLLQSKNSKHVNSEQLILWSKGICAILNGEPLLGAYMLMPQVEFIIRSLAEERLGDMTKLTDDVQHETTLGGVLEKMKPEMSEAMNDELRFFLVDGCDVNLRNEMMHGLIENPMQVQKYSVYLLYIALNLFFREDNFLFQHNNNEEKPKE